MANYSLVADYSFRPFTFDEMVKPLLMYKDEYNKRLEDYLELNKNADVFSYLSQTLPENSAARQLYEGYANAKNAAFEDFSRNGLNINNKRALVDLKRRYQGEIGRLEQADKALQKERDVRAEMRAKDPSMLYAKDNITIDDFLDNNEPNMYRISGNDLYTQAAKASAAMSSRIFGAKDNGRILGNYYRDYLTTMGYTPEQVATFSSEMQDRINADFTQRVSTLPELQEAAVRLLESQGVINTATGESNLTGNNLRMAQQQVIRGLVDGAVYQESHKPMRDEGVMSTYQSASIGLQREAEDNKMTLYGYTKGADGKYTYNPKDNAHNTKANGSTSGGRSSANYANINTSTMAVGINDGKIYSVEFDESGNNITKVGGYEVEGKVYTVDTAALDVASRTKIMRMTGKADLENYTVLRIPANSIGGMSSKINQDIYIAKPRKPQRDGESSGTQESVETTGDGVNDIPQP